MPYLPNGLRRFNFFVFRMFYAPKQICVNICECCNWFQAVATGRPNEKKNAVPQQSINTILNKTDPYRLLSFKAEWKIPSGNLERWKDSKALCLWDTGSGPKDWTHEGQYVPIWAEQRAWITVGWEVYLEQLLICGEAVGSWGWVGGVVIGTAGLITVAEFVSAGPPVWTAPREPFAVGDPPTRFLGWPAPAGTLERKKLRKKRES